MAIALTVADYPRLMPIATSAVRPEGVDLAFVLGRAGSWANCAEMLSRALSDPAVQDNAVFAATQRSLPRATPWMEAEADDALLGPDARADGLEPNRAATAIFLDEAHRAHITRRRVGLEEYFTEYLES